MYVFRAEALLHINHQMNKLARKPSALELVNYGQTLKEERKLNKKKDKSLGKPLPTPQQKKAAEKEEKRFLSTLRKVELGQYLNLLCM